MHTTCDHIQNYTYMGCEIEASAFKQEDEWFPEYRITNAAAADAPSRRPDVMGFRDRDTAVLMAVEYGIYDIRSIEYAKYGRVMPY